MRPPYRPAFISSMWRSCVPQQPPNTFGFRCARDRQCGNEVSVALSERTNLLSVIRLCPPVAHYLAGIITAKSAQVRRPSERSFHPAAANDRDISSLGLSLRGKPNRPFVSRLLLRPVGEPDKWGRCPLVRNPVSRGLDVLTLRTTAAWGDTKEHQNCQHS